MLIVHTSNFLFRSWEESITILHYDTVIYCEYVKRYVRILKRICISESDQIVVGELSQARLEFLGDQSKSSNADHLNQAAQRRCVA